MFSPLGSGQAKAPPSDPFIGRTAGRADGSLPPGGPLGSVPAMPLSPTDPAAAIHSANAANFSNSQPYFAQAIRPLRLPATTSTFRRRWPGNTSSRRQPPARPPWAATGAKRQPVAFGPQRPGRRQRPLTATELLNQAKRLRSAMPRWTTVREKSRSRRQQVPGHDEPG